MYFNTVTSLSERRKAYLNRPGSARRQCRSFGLSEVEHGHSGSRRNTVLVGRTEPMGFTHGIEFSCRRGAHGVEISQAPGLPPSFSPHPGATSASDMVDEKSHPPIFESDLLNQQCEIMEVARAGSIGRTSDGNLRRSASIYSECATLIATESTPSETKVPALDSDQIDPSLLMGIRVDQLAGLCNLLKLDANEGVTWLDVQANVRELTTGGTKSALQHISDDTDLKWEGLLDSVGLANTIVCHSPSCKVQDVIEAVLEYDAEAVLWLEVLSVPQDGKPAKWKETFLPLVRSIGKVVMVMVPDDNPSPTLTQAWCAFELVGCVATESVFDVAMPRDVRSSFLHMLQDDVTDVWKAISVSQISGHECEDAEVGEMIGHAIAEAGGYGRVNSLVVVQLTGWLTRCLIAESERAPTSRERAAYLHALGQIRFFNGEFGTAAESLQEAWEMRQCVLGEKHADTLWSMSWLGHTFASLARYREAAELLRSSYKAMRQLERVCPVRLLSTTRFLGVLRGIHLGKLSKGAAALEHCVAEAGRCFGPSDDLTLEAMGDLAASCSLAGDLARSRRLREEVWAARVERDGAAHPETLAAQAAVAVALFEDGRYEEAIREQKRVLEQSREVLGDEHAATLAAMGSLAVTLSHIGELEVAEGLQVQAMERSAEALGRAHPDALAAKNDLANTYASKGEFAKARELHAEALARSGAGLGEDHPATLLLLHDAARAAAQEAGAEGSALQLQQEVACRSSEALGPSHPFTLTAMRGLGHMLSEGGELQRAEALHTAVCHRSKEALGPDHRLTLLAMSSVADTLAAGGAVATALELGAVVLARSRAVLGCDHPDTLTAMHNLGTMHAEQGDHRRAVELQGEVLGWSRAVLGLEHPDTLAAMRAQARSLSELGDFIEAEDLAVEAVEASTEELGAAHPDTLVTLRTLADIYAAHGELAKAEQLLARCAASPGEPLASRRKVATIRWRHRAWWCC